ncbi:group III truncated hemoglobin [Pusillimonas sp. CC-YST705]|uniref:Group III truncated hemoglobin n=1 Tax=Mesopusillimonas faecipullorum TaxID=2755040 RepID=A0ABS8CBU8_9BURK|nr:group III truncated hemoglobin [Mesopusillimonas faecipullorum]MCB5363516.1 group III truncated hemoglobin [Mesopusillimonas faecipullorum]
MTQRDTLCTQEEITTLVHSFYDRIRQDETLGPIFNAHVHDWDVHLARMVSFWSSMLLGAGTYDGTPMPKHIALPDLKAELFEHWLALFQETTQTLPNQALAERAQELAHRIARSLWFGYQLHRQPERPVTEIRHG